MEWVRSLGRSIQQRSQPECSLEVVVVNLTGCEIRLPEHYALVLSGELHLAPEMFDASKSLPPGHRGSFFFTSNEGQGSSFSGAVAMIIVDDFAAKHGRTSHRRLFLGGRSSLGGQGRLAVRWESAQCATDSSIDRESRHAQQRVELLRFQQECPTLPLEELSEADRGACRQLQIGSDRFCAMISRSSATLGHAVVITLRHGDLQSSSSRESSSTRGESAMEDISTSNKMSALSWQRIEHLEQPASGSKSQAKDCTARPLASRLPVATSMPLASRRKWLLVTVLNYTGVGMTFPPNFASGVAAGEAWKEKAYVGPNHSCQLAMADDVHFAGLAFCRLGNDCERLYIEASNTLFGSRSFNVFFRSRHRCSPATNVDQSRDLASSSAAKVAGWAMNRLATVLRPEATQDDDNFLGEFSDEIVRGKDFEALITDAWNGENAAATIAVYPVSTIDEGCTGTGATAGDDHLDEMDPLL